VAKKLPQILIITGCLLIVASLSLFIYIFAPVINVEINYNLDKPKLSISQIKPVDKDFGIIIPAIGANSKIIANVDPYDSGVYQLALTKGVAQAQGSAMPDSPTGNMFLFSHSSANILETSKYNSVFYLLSKLKKGDEVYIYYKNVKYKYVASEIKIVDAKNVSYLSLKSDIRSLTLMTCWPPGTNYKRLIVIAIPQS
jgi:LPXTG-site transpeptidase (sortase) family protein